ncbi:hypothetical protein FMM56_03535 [Campylobacter sp. LR264d]|uniref:hypothetical protein n=1 Tax=Campylobacter sp. LR264d TaxID=2593544 RepID=UPI001239B1B4|nr:hypothetical protein [Campylobacter sp. LR264d]KAA6233592.1 hypothetical protein FMM56_03535 [Campylobacter sp. LR264d]
MLNKCRDIIRNAEKHDTAKTFDEIAKVLFMKVHIERNALKQISPTTNIFSLKYIEDKENDPGRNFNESVFKDMFDQTKKEFSRDKILWKMKK